MAEPTKYVVLVKDKAGTNSYEFEKSTSLSWDWYENDVGACRFTIPYNDVKLNSTSIPDNAFSEILIYRNQSLVWQGFIAYIEDTKDGTTVYGLTYMEVFKYLPTGFNGVDDDSSTRYVSQQIPAIINTLWSALGNYAWTTNKITKGTIETVYQTGTSTAKTISKTFFDEYWFDMLRQFVDFGRSDSPSGAWKQDTVFEITFSETTPTFNFWRDVGSNKSDVILELDSEIVNFNFGVDFRALRNSIVGYAITDGPLVINNGQSDATSSSTYYRRRLSPLISGVTNTDQLSEKTKYLLKSYKDPLKNFSIQLASGLIPFSGYSMGDSIKIRINRGRVNVDQFFRVIGMEVNLDQNGVETVKPQLQVQKT